MTDTNRKRGGQWLFSDRTRPHKYYFKDHPDIRGQLERIQADLEAYDIRASKSGILRFLVNNQLDSAVEIIRNHVEGKDHGAGSQEEVNARC